VLATPLTFDERLVSRYFAEQIFGVACLFAFCDALLELHQPFQGDGVIEIAASRCVEV
jgi:hypothetical protein